jgi:hypothetical protein
MCADLILVLIEGREDRRAEAEAIVEWSSGRVGCRGAVCALAMSYQEAQMFNAKYLGLWLDANAPGWGRVISCQTDGYPYNPAAWEAAFLDYDYIGPPWPQRLVAGATGLTVGSSGCCLRTRQFIEACGKLPYEVGMNDDVWMCQRQRSALEGLGMKFAPVEVAARFAVEEGETEAWPALGGTFAFHGMNADRREFLEKLKG